MTVPTKSHISGARKLAYDSDHAIIRPMKFSKSTEDAIADFRGVPRSETSVSLKEPVALDDLVAALKEQYQLEKPGPERVLVENWEAVFGPGLAHRCHPVRIKDEHTLIVSVANQTLRSELQFRKRELLKKIRGLEHCGSIRELVVRS